MKYKIKPLAMILFVFTITMPITASAAKLALVIGISKYSNLHSLTNPAQDVINLSEKLYKLGYVVSVVKDPNDNRDKLISSFDDFSAKIKPHDEVVVYYSGHGVDIDGDNMFVPADSPKPDEVSTSYGLKQRLVSMRPWMTEIQNHNPDIQVWIVDACRENPYADSGKGFSNAGGLTKFEHEPQNSFIFFAADYTQIALERLPSDPKGASLGSPFTRTFVRDFDQYQGRYITDFAKQLRKDVVDLVFPDPQYPMYEDGVLQQWCFGTCQVQRENTLALTGVVPKQSQSKVGSSQASPLQLSKLNKKVTYKSYELPPTYGANHQPASHVVMWDEDDIPLLRMPIEPNDQQVVFLGKRSASNCTDDKVSNSYPFSCKSLQIVDAFFQSSPGKLEKGLAGQKIVATTDVDIRQGVPKRGLSGLKDGCKSGLMHGGDVAQVDQIAAFDFPSDTFYWAILKAPGKACLH